ncbi:16000_t:CDS:2, partial [Gigaspora rosea]
ALLYLIQIQYSNATTFKAKNSAKTLHFTNKIRPGTTNKVLKDSIKNWNTITRPFRMPLKNLNQPLHLLPHINAMKDNPTLGRRQRLYKHNCQTSKEEPNGNVDIKNYYINTDNVTIN